MIITEQAKGGVVKKERKAVVDEKGELKDAW